MLKFELGLPKKQISKNVENIWKFSKIQNSTPHYIDKLPIHRLGGPILLQSAPAEDTIQQSMHAEAQHAGKTVAASSRRGV